MVSSIINLFGDSNILNQCPMKYDYKFIPLDSTYTVGSRFLFIYTIAIDSLFATDFDKQRTYSLSSEFFSNNMNYGSLRTVSSDVENGENYTYSQFPITKHLTVMYCGSSYGYIESPFIDISLAGYAVDGCQDISILEGDIHIQQSSSFTMCIPDSSDYDDD
jgi:hypothetical protein